MGRSVLRDSLGMGASYFWSHNDGGNDFDRVIFDPAENGMPKTFDRTAVVVGAAAGYAGGEVGAATNACWR